jgi:diaminopimelate epimerase
VDFVQVLTSNKIKVRTYERGVEEETLSCGTGVVASALVASICKKTVFPIEVVTRGGLLRVYQESRDEHLLLEGEVKIVYEGRLISG